jgi:xanthine/uracil permease
MRCIHPLIESGILLASIAAVVLNAFFNGNAVARLGHEKDRELKP